MIILELFYGAVFSLLVAVLYLVARHDFEEPGDAEHRNAASKQEASLKSGERSQAVKTHLDDMSKAPSVSGLESPDTATTQKPPEDGTVHFAGMNLRGSQAEFVKKYIIPNLEVFECQGATRLLVSGMEFLERHGNCSSVILGPRDLESDALYSERVLLAEVTLKDHCYRVAANLIDLIMTKDAGKNDRVPLAAITGLYHDVGKTTAYNATCSGHGPTHAQVSANRLLVPGMGGMEFEWLEEAVRAVRDHHTSSRDPFTLLLKEADRRAREIELVQRARDIRTKSLYEWFKPSHFMARLERRINRFEGRDWDVLGYDGVIYARPDFIYKLGRMLCREALAIDSLFLRASEKEDAIKAILGLLREAGYVHEMLPVNFYQLSFMVFFGNNPEYGVRCSLIPLKDDALDFEGIEMRYRSLSMDLCIRPCL